MLLHDRPFTPPGSGLASAIGLSVANIDDPSAELGVIAGLVVGEFRLCYQTVAGANEWTLYSWDSASSAGASTPYRINGSSGQWIAVTGKYHNSSHSLNSNLTITGGNITQTGATTLSTGTGGVSLNGSTVITGTLGVGTGVAPAANIGVAWAAPSTLTGATLLGQDMSTYAFPSCTTARGINGSVGTTNAAFTITSLVGFYAGANTKGASATVTRSASFHSRTQTVGGTGNFGYVYNNAVGLPAVSGTYAWYNDTADPEDHGTGQSTFRSTTDATSTTTGSLTTLGGASVAKNLITGQGLGLGITSTATAAGTTTLTNASDAVQKFTGTTTQTVQFPAANLFGTGVAVRITIDNHSTGIVTPTRAGSDTFKGGGTTYPVAGGASTVFVSDGVSVWGLE